MADLRKDPVTGRWVIISTERQKRPTDFHIETVTTSRDELCPFCQGHEDKTPPEILSYRDGGGWDVRVVPNKFPALRVEGDLDREGEGLFDPHERHRGPRSDHRDASPRSNARDDGGAGD